MNEPIELLTIAESARRLAVCGVTLRRRIARAGLQPDAYLLEGSTGQRSPLFVQPRLHELETLMKGSSHAQ